MKKTFIQKRNELNALLETRKELEKQIEIFVCKKKKCKNLTSENEVNQNIELIKNSISYINTDIQKLQSELVKDIDNYGDSLNSYHNCLRNFYINNCRYVGEDIKFYTPDTLRKGISRYIEKIQTIQSSSPTDKI